MGRQLAMGRLLGRGWAGIVSLIALAAASPDPAARADGYAEQLRSLNPAAWWRLGEAGGATAFDAAAKPQDGSYRNGPLLGLPGALDDDPDTAAAFDGVSQFVEVPHADKLLLDEGTIVVWIRPYDTRSAGAFLSKEAGGRRSGGYLRLWVQNDRVRVRLTSNSAEQTLASPRDLLANDWHQVVLTFGPAGLRLYVDGDPADSANFFSGLGSSSGGSNREPLVIGASQRRAAAGTASPLDDYFTGEIDEPAFLAQALGETEVLALYQSALPHYGSLVEAYRRLGPRAWWRLNEQAADRTAVDEMGQHPGSYQGPTKPWPGVPLEGGNTSARFDGSDDRVTVGRFDLAGDAISLFAWFKAESLEAREGQFLAKAARASDPDWALGYGGQGGRRFLTFRLAADQTQQLRGDAADLSVGVWTFVAAVYDGRQMTLYRDGVRVGQVDQSGPLAARGSAAVWLGDSPPGGAGQAFHGLLDELAVFDKAVTPAQVAAVYSARGAEGESGLVNVPVLWGVNENDGVLFSAANYTDLARTTSSYGPLLWNDAGTLRPVGRGLHALAADARGILYLAKDGRLGRFASPVLLTFDSRGAAVGQNVVSIVGTLATGDTVHGLALDPTADVLYALRTNGSLYRVDKATAAVLADLGRISGDGRQVRSAQDLTFDPLGSLYVVDNNDDSLYLVDKSSATILRRWTGRSGQIQALAWDPRNGQILSVDTRGDLLAYSTLDDYAEPLTSAFASTNLGSVRATTFVPSGGHGGSPGVRIIRWVEIP